MDEGGSIASVTSGCSISAVEVYRAKGMGGLYDMS